MSADEAMNRFHMVLLLIVSTAVAGILIVIRVVVVRAESKRQKKRDIAKIDSSSIKGKECSAGSSLQASATIVQSGADKTCKVGVYAQDAIVLYYSTRFLGY